MLSIALCMVVEFFVLLAIHRRVTKRLLAQIPLALLIGIVCGVLVYPAIAYAFDATNPYSVLSSAVHGAIHQMFFALVTLFFVRWLEGRPNS